MQVSRPLANNKTDQSSDPLASFKQGSLEVKRQLLVANGGYYDGTKAAALLGISESALIELRQQAKIVGLPLADNSYVYPKWQFVKTWFFRHRLLKGLDLVLAALPDSDPWIQAAFMLDRQISTEIETPLSGLYQGRLDLVINIAKSFGEQGAV